MGEIMDRFHIDTYLEYFLSCPESREQKGNLEYLATWSLNKWVVAVHWRTGGNRGDGGWGERIVQVNVCQKLLFLHQLTHNMTTDCSLNYKFNTWKLQAQTWGEHFFVQKLFLTFRTIFVHNICSPHVLQKEELLTKIYLYLKILIGIFFVLTMPCFIILYIIMMWVRTLFQWHI